MQTQQDQPRRRGGVRIKEIRDEEAGMGGVVSDSRTVCRALLSPAVKMELWEQKGSRMPWQSVAGKGGDTTVLNLDMNVNPQLV